MIEAFSLLAGDLLEKWFVLRFDAFVAPAVNELLVFPLVAFNSDRVCSIDGTQRDSDEEYGHHHGA